MPRSDKKCRSDGEIAAPVGINFYNFYLWVSFTRYYISTRKPSSSSSSEAAVPSFALWFIAGRWCLIIIIGNLVRNEAALKNFSLPFACMLYFLRVYQLAFNLPLCFASVLCLCALPLCFAQRQSTEAKHRGK